MGRMHRGWVRTGLLGPGLLGQKWEEKHWESPACTSNSTSVASFVFKGGRNGSPDPERFPKWLSHHCWIKEAYCSFLQALMATHARLTTPSLLLPWTVMVYLIHLLTGLGAPWRHRLCPTLLSCHRHPEWPANI